MFVTAVSHRLDAHAVAVLGGGFYARGKARHGLLRSAGGEYLARLRPHPVSAIDYYRAIYDDGRARVGDPVVFAFRFQAFVTRAPVAAVTGLPGNARIVSISDPYGQRLARSERSVAEMAP